MATALANIVSLDEIELTVLANMRLAIYPQEIARAGEHNSATFRIVSQPATLDGLPCRAEILAADGAKFHVLVTDGTFRLTNDITKHGVGTIQLVYSDASVSHKTQQAQYWVAPSVDAIDPSAPDHVDGLAQLSNAAFAQAGTLGTILAFANIYGREVARVTFPGAGLDEETANQLYLRLNGGRMAGAITFDAGQGLAFLPGNSAIQEQAGTLSARHGVGPFSPIITVTDGDGRYLQLAGGTVTGPVMSPLQSQPAQQELINRGYADARFVSLDGGNLAGPINAIYDASNPAAGNLVTRNYVVNGFVSNAQADQLFLRKDTLSPQQMQGMLITAMGTGNTPGLAIGSNDTGFWRTGTNLLVEVGLTPVCNFTPSVVNFYQQIAVPGNPTQPQHATDKAYVDNQITVRALAPSLLSTMPANFVLTSDFQQIVFRTYQIPRGGLSRVLVTVGGGMSYGAPNQLAMVQVRINPGNLLHNQFVYSVQDGPSGPVEGSSLALAFTVDVSGTAPTISVEIRTVGAAPPGLALIGGSTDPQRTAVMFTDLGPRTAAGETEEAPP